MSEIYSKAQHMSKAELQALLPLMDRARVAIIGDLCLDVYWDADMKKSEISRETPHHPLPVVGERYSPGGASNAAANIKALEPASLAVIGVIGRDWRGDMLKDALAKHGISSEYIVEDGERVTNTYIKPMRHGISDVVYEDPRIDFENYLPLSKETEDKLIASLECAAETADVICVSDQLKCGCITERVRERLCELGASGKTVIVDSRDRGALYHHVTLKPNEVEASRAFGNGSELTVDELAELALGIAKKNGRVTLTTLGGNGCFVADGDRVTLCPAWPVEPPIDFCGAGDTFLSGFAVMLAASAPAVDAARVANLCSAVTIKKIGITGTATREELLTLCEKIN